MSGSQWTEERQNAVQQQYNSTKSERVCVFQRMVQYFYGHQELVPPFIYLVIVLSGYLTLRVLADMYVGSYPQYISSGVTVWLLLLYWVLQIVDPGKLKAGLHMPPPPASTVPSFLFSATSKGSVPSSSSGSTAELSHPNRRLNSNQSSGITGSVSMTTPLYSSSSNHQAFLMQQQEYPNQHLHDHISSCYCDRCERTRPKRSHHCSSCKTCVQMRDHHCVWLSTCVGKHNIRPFLFFLGNLLLVASAYLVILLYYYVFYHPSTLIAPQFKGLNLFQLFPAILIPFGTLYASGSLISRTIVCLAHGITFQEYLLLEREDLLELLQPIKGHTTSEKLQHAWNNIRYLLDMKETDPIVGLFKLFCVCPIWVLFGQAMDSYDNADFGDLPV